MITTMKSQITLLALSVFLAVACSGDEASPIPVEIQSFDLVGLPFSSPVIDVENKSIIIEVLFGTDLTNLVAKFSLSEDGIVTVDGITQISGVTANDFSSPKIYRVTANNQSQAVDWSVSVVSLAQQPVVSTFALVASNGGIAVKSDGTVFSTSESDKVYKISPTGVVETFVSGDPNITRATMIIFDNSEEYLYVSNTSLTQPGWITKVGLDGTSEVFTSGYSVPTGIAFDNSNNLYIADQNNSIWKVNAAGLKTIFSQNSDFNRPHGMAWAEGSLYVASAHDGNIFKVSDTKSSLFAHVNGLKQQWAAGYMVYLDGSLFITNGDNKIHQISMSGTVSDYAGSGASGSDNGPASNATFNGPNGIGGTVDGTKIYLGEYNVGTIRLIQN